MGEKVNSGRWAAEIDGDFVVFIIGAKPTVRRFVSSLRDLGGIRGMKRLLDHLTEHPEKGLLGWEGSTVGTIVQYWRSFEDLERFANDKDDPHVAAWRNYWKRVGKDTRSGIWHETFLVRAGEYEAIYANMPAYGLGKASRVVPLAANSSARHRLRRLAN